MTTQDDDLKTSRSFPVPQRPRDAATLIVLKRDGTEPRILMGKRHAGHKFMPNMYVFPGGRLDPEDCRMRPGRDLEAGVLGKLMLRMRGRASIGKARGLALAAVRETFEETGFIVGTPHGGEVRPRGEAWGHFLATGHSPDLSGLVYFARAITPPGRTRRFDTRFFAVDAGALANVDDPRPPDPGELLSPAWFTFAQALALDLPFITRDVLTRLAPVVETLPQPRPVPFQYMKGKSWRLDHL